MSGFVGARRLELQVFKEEQTKVGRVWKSKSSSDPSRQLLPGDGAAAGAGLPSRCRQRRVLPCGPCSRFHVQVALGLRPTELLLLSSAVDPVFP